MNNNETLYHFFPRKKSTLDETLSTIKSFFKNGIFLTHETIPVTWPDLFYPNNTRKLTIDQYRFCLTSITTNEELVEHSKKFGKIGIEFDLNLIIKLGGFPVFYVPSPRQNCTDLSEHMGVSLLYRIAEMQEIVEFIIKNKILISKDIDIENVLGAIKFLGNICYPTKKMSSRKPIQYNYYNQREWRIIYGLLPEQIHSHKVEFQNNIAFAIKEYNNNHVRNYIKRIVLNEDISTKAGKYKNRIIKEYVMDLLKMYNLEIEITDLNYQ